MFQKVGDAQPLEVVHTCCVCEMAAAACIDGKHYCGTHIPPQSVQPEESQKLTDEPQ